MTRTTPHRTRHDQNNTTNDHTKNEVDPHGEAAPQLRIEDSHLK